MRHLVVMASLSVLFWGADGQADICGRTCQSDVECPDSRGVCTYCRHGQCSPVNAQCGGPTKAATTKPQLLVIGDSISIGWAPTLFPMLPGYESQHDPVNAGPASKGFECVHSWVGNATAPAWDVILFNFGLHSLDRPATAETETLANYTAEVEAIAAVLLKRSKRVIWVSTTPVPLNVTQGPGRHNADVTAFNAAAAGVMAELGIPTADAFAAVMKACPPTTGAPDHTYISCSLQTPGGVHFPGHYQPIADAIFSAVTGNAPPPMPPPAGCSAALAAARCVGMNGSGTGDACRACFMAHHRPVGKPNPFAPCLAPFNISSHPQVSFIDCYCDRQVSECPPAGIADCEAATADECRRSRCANGATFMCVGGDGVNGACSADPTHWSLQAACTRCVDTAGC